MRFRLGRSGSAASLIVAALVAGPAYAQNPVTVQQSIESRSIGDLGYFQNGELSDGPATFSPDGTHFAIITRQGDLASNTNIFELSFYASADAARGRLTSIRTLSYSSNTSRSGIHALRWHIDGSITFIAEIGGGAQIVSLTGPIAEPVVVTKSETPIVSYDLDLASKRIAYVAMAKPRGLWQRGDVHVVDPREKPQDLLAERIGFSAVGPKWDFALWVQSKGNAVPLTVNGAIAPGAVPAFSPDGRHVAIVTFLAADDVPQRWRDYPGDWISSLLYFDQTRQQKGSFFAANEIVDLVSGRSKRLLSAPAILGQSKPVWSPSGTSIFTQAPKRATVPARSDGPALIGAAEVDTATGAVRYLPKNCSVVVGWDQRQGQLLCHSARAPSKVIGLRLDRGKWRSAGVHPTPHRPIIVDLAENFQTIPKLIVRDSASGRELASMYVDEQLADLHLAKVETISLKLSDGHVANGGLYYPIGYRPDRKYPLVIQTHGWPASRFQLGGAVGAGYAAQALAARGMFVLQLDEMRDDLSQKLLHREELESVLESYRAAIGLLAERNLIDRRKVGIIGWSRTCFYVKYALAHTDLFAAAAVAEGEDGSYLSFMTNNNVFIDSQSLYGGPPFGANLANWLARSPSFNLNKVTAPLRILSLSPFFILGDWEWFAGLSRLGKPTELVMLRDGDHFLQRPEERYVAEEGNVDWFDFWLNGRENGGSEKRDQYARWKALRATTRAMAQ